MRKVRSKECLALLLLLLPLSLLSTVLAALHVNHVLVVHLSRLQSLKLVHLEWVQLLAREHLLLNQGHLALRKLYQLWLSVVLE